MYYDLNIPYIANHGELERTLAFLSERQSPLEPGSQGVDNANTEKWATILLHWILP